jgi:tocopherol O-methyltransferase
LDRDIAAHYDDLDTWYRTAWGEHVHHGLWRTGRESQAEAVRGLITHLADALAIAPGDQVCDIGSGYGGTARVLAEDYGADVDGYTISERQHALALEQHDCAPTPRFYLMNWMDNDMPNSVSDVVIAVESTEHFEDKAAMIAEMYRVLKPGGRVGIYTWVAGPSPTDWQRHRLLEPICIEGHLPNLGDESDYRQWMSDAGFADVCVENLTRNVRKTLPLISLRMLWRLTWDIHAWRQLVFGPNRVLAKTMLRIMTAYYTGAMQYGLIVARKAGVPSSSNFI